ncbi:twin-arginine translocation signal domain-containing protein [Pararhizobium haloflavum]|uniref:twin-arginine translocation signal domain-containing protein n=1 Tax=Pararhizobium haloflavum TaxID=2037914 RepID=UPI000C19654E|nr:twin-arginine translocation signal domain-containing protein [Pararhizobium haloflavum]
MTTVYKAPEGISRRDLLKRGGAVGAVALLAVSGSTIVSVDRVWGMETTALKPETMATLIQMARDIYPHDQLADKYYAVAVKEHETKAGADETHKSLIEDGIADLDGRAGEGGYRALGWEDDRVAILKEIEDTPFFQAIRGGLVVGIYNQPEVWPIFGYEGESYSQGGYINRGFDDIEWI